MEEMSRKEIKSKYSGLTYPELLRASDNITPGKDARELHKELKKYGDGLFFLDRYPAMTKVGIYIAIIGSATLFLPLLRLFRL